MSNGDWIDRVRNTRPEDLSPGDLKDLRDQLRRSPELRRAVADEIQLDQALHAATSRPLSTSKIVAHVTGAAAAGAMGAGGSLFVTVASWLFVAVVTVGLVVAGVMYMPDLGNSRPDEAISPGPGQLVESLAPERIDPVLDPRFVDDGSSPSDLRSKGTVAVSVDRGDASSAKSADRKVADGPIRDK